MGVGTGVRISIGVGTGVRISVGVGTVTGVGVVVGTTVVAVGTEVGVVVVVAVFAAVAGMAVLDVLETTCVEMGVLVAAGVAGCEVALSLDDVVAVKSASTILAGLPSTA